MPLAEFFNPMLGRSFPGRMKRMVIDQFLVCRKIIGFNGEVLFFERFRAGRRTEVGAIRFSLFLCREPAQPTFPHSGGEMPKSQLDRTPLVDAEGTVCNLKSVRQM